MSNRVEKQGWLWKQGEARKSWKKRWMILSGTNVRYFSGPKETNVPKGAFSLEGYTIRPVDFSRFKKKFAFEIDKADARTYYMYADSQEDQEHWMSLLLSAATPMVWGLSASKRRRPLDDSEDAPPGLTLIRRFAELPLLKEAPVWQQRMILKQKLMLCSVHFDFDATMEDDDEEIRMAQDRKRSTLLELIDFCDTVRGAFNDVGMFQDVLRMIEENVFRALPSDRGLGMDEEDEEQPFMEPSWPHVSIVYELLLRVVQSNEIELIIKKKNIDSRFVLRLLDLFDSQDMRERDYLKTITHRIYGKLTNRRALIRRSISNIFFQFIYETDKHAGIAELLEILGSIINGFAVPVKNDHISLLKSALIPLHKSRNVGMYHAHLAYCMGQYVGKEQKHAEVIVEGILKHWPYASSTKQILFLNELEELVESLAPPMMARVEKQLYRRIAACVDSEHFQVAERALHFWGNEMLNQIVVDDEEHRRAVLPIVFPALYRNRMETSDAHWQLSVREGAVFVLQRYENVDPILYQECVEKFLGSRGKK